MEVGAGRRAQRELPRPATRAGEGRRASWAAVAHAETELVGDEGAWRAEADTDAEQLCSCSCATGEWV